MSRNIFIVGTGTDVGKTFVAGLIVKKLYTSGRKAAYYKAAMSGNVRGTDGRLIPQDALCVKQMSGISQGTSDMCPYVYENAVSPHLASRIEGNPVRMDVVKQCFQKVCSEYEYVTVEGSGGILCPICVDGEKIFLEDIIRELGLPSVIVADAGLGTINHVGLTADYMRRRGLPVKGIIFNHWQPGNIMQEDNRAMCEMITGLKVLACVKEGAEELDMDEDSLAGLYE